MGKTLVLPEVNINFEGGGSYAVSKNMYLSDKKSFFHYIISKNSNKKIKGNHPKKILPDFLIKIISKMTLFGLIYHLRLLHHMRKNILSYDINNYNYIISHNILQTFSLIYFFKIKNIIYIHHLNGTYYNEFSQRNGKSIIFKLFCNYIEKYIFKNIKNIGFPSIGAKNNFGNKDLLKDKKIHYFYNGVDYKYIDTTKKEKNSFVTVLDCTKFKGIDRIPTFLHSLKKLGINFHWTYIGNGILLKKIEDDLKKFDLVKNTTLISNRIPKKEILKHFSKNTFYLGFHRTSIFDYATLEAMSQGCIPILTNVGGNKEVILNKNGLLIDESKLNKADNLFLNYINNNNLEKLKYKNIDLIKSHFSSKQFIKNYVNFIEKNV